MEDVSAKVDLLFDRIIDPDDDYNVLMGKFVVIKKTTLGLLGYTSFLLYG